jgi:hypothetical protein
MMDGVPLTLLTVIIWIGKQRRRRCRDKAHPPVILFHRLFVSEVIPGSAPVLRSVMLSIKMVCLVDPISLAFWSTYDGRAVCNDTRGEVGMSTRIFNL